MGRDSMKLNNHVVTAKNKGEMSTKGKEDQATKGMMKPANWGHRLLNLTLLYYDDLHLSFSQRTTIRKLAAHINALCEKWFRGYRKRNYSLPSGSV